MVRVEDFYGEIVGLDTQAFLAYVERKSSYADILHSFFLTNDASLPSLPNLKMLQLDELKTR